MKILIGAMISPYPYPSPGMVLHRMQYVKGLQKLGHQVSFIEELDPEWCINENGEPCNYEKTIRRGLFQSVMETFELFDTSCQIYNRGEKSFGLSVKSLTEISREADLLLNWSGHVKSDFVIENVRRKVYLDQDPVFTQLWNSQYGVDLNFKDHDIFFSVGLNIGTPRTKIPDCGIKWNPLLPPVVLDHWNYEMNTPKGPFSTIASWSGFGDISYQDEWYSSKWREFERFADLPKRSGQPFEVALKDFRTEDPGIELLKSSGWNLVHANQIKDIPAYIGYIRNSCAEIGIAQNAYVKSNCGWFSDRSSHYLASGKPVLAQATGFEQTLPVGEGIIAFKNMEEALAGIEAINNDYEMHCKAARRFAETNLDAAKTLGRMLEVCLS